MEDFCRVGMYFDNVKKLSVRDVSVEGVIGDELIANHIGEIIK